METLDVDFPTGEVHIIASVPSCGSAQSHGMHAEEGSSRRQSRRSAAAAALAAIRHTRIAADETDNSSEECQTELEDETSEDEVKAMSICNATSRTESRGESTRATVPTAHLRSNKTVSSQKTKLSTPQSLSWKTLSHSNNSLRETHDDCVYSLSHGLNTQQPKHIASNKLKVQKQNTNSEPVNIILSCDKNCMTKSNLVVHKKGELTQVPLHTGGSVRNSPIDSVQDVDQSRTQRSFPDILAIDEEEPTQQSRTINSLKHRNLIEPLKFESNEFHQKVTKHNDYQANDNESNNCQVPEDARVLGTITVHPKSGLLVLQICDITGNQNGSVLYECLKCTEIFSVDIYEQTHCVLVNSEQIFHCHICGEETQRHHIFATHLNQHYVNKKRRCPICKKECGSKKDLKLHLATVHSANRPYKCQLCCKTFKTTDTLQSHKRMHNEEKPFECEICRETFKRKGSLQRHLGTHPEHFDILKCVCHICGKIYLKSNISQHMKSHSSLSLQCNICDKVFRSQLHLSTHVKNNHKTTQSHMCEVCGKLLKTLGLLRDHMNTHSGMRPFICKICGKSFFGRKHLRHHSKTHAEKKFKCDICGFCSHRMENLVTHIRSHTGEKPYCCSICGKKCSRGDNLRGHMRRVHGVDLGLK